MVVYADILIVLNLLVNYFLISTVSKLLKKTVKQLRLILAALLGAVAALYIFLPEPGILAELLFKVSLCFGISTVAFGFSGLKQWLKTSGLLFAVTCCYAGITAAVWHIFKPSGMLIHNSVVYFDISPAILIFFTVAAYFVFTLLNRIFSRTSRCAEECNITVKLNGKVLGLKGILDTGNSVSDVFGKSEIVITDKRHLSRLLCGEEGTEEMKRRFRAVPCKTVGGASVLIGYRCDSAVVSTDVKTVTLERPILVSAETEFSDGYTAIVNPEILE